MTCNLEIILDRIDRSVAALERQGIKPPRIDGLPSRHRRARAIGNVIADMAREARGPELQAALDNRERK